MSALLNLPPPLARLFALFPLKTYPPIVPLSKVPISTPTLWVHPPHAQSDVLSADVECLKWQAYIALRGLTHIAVRYDVKPEGGIDGRLPNLHVPWSESLETEKVKKLIDGVEDGELLAAHMIPTWVDANLDVYSGGDLLEGYKDEATRDESRAWVALLEGTVHAALIIAQPKPSYLHSLLFYSSGPSIKGASNPLQILLTPPPPPATNMSSLLPSFGTRVPTASILSQYREAIASLSERLGDDKWFLSSTEATPLDALLFAYLHCLLYAHDDVRIEVSRRANLVAWEERVRTIVRAAFSV